MNRNPARESSVSDALKQCDAVLLDFNGTLSDDEELLAELVAEISERELGVPVSRDRYFEEFAGFTEEHMFGVLAAEATRSAPTPTELMHRFNQRYLERTAERSTISGTARDFVRACRAAGKSVVVVTAASREVVVPALEQAGLSEHLRGVIGLEDVAAAKPDPAGYLLALERLGVGAQRALAFEDSRTGIAAATGAGLRTVGVVGSLGAEALGELTPLLVDALEPQLLD